MKKRCTLCGGKVFNGICSECGMDNRKSDEQYKIILKQRQAESEARTHAFRKEKNEARKKAMKNKEARYSTINTKQTSSSRKNLSGGNSGRTGYSRSNTKSSSYAGQRFKTNDGEKNSTRRDNGKKKKKGSLFWVILIVVLLIFGDNLLSIAQRGSVYVEEWLDQNGENHSDSTKETGKLDWLNFGSEEADDYDASSENEWDPYAYVEEKLKPEGEHWTEKLSAGMYVVGVDLPEGEYTITGKEGNSYSLWDGVHNLSVNEYFGTEDYQVEREEGAKLFNGALINVDGMDPVVFETDNGQVQSMTPRQSNPLTQDFEFSDTAVAGTDFPAGTYDVEVVDDRSSFFEYEIQTGTGEYAYPVTFYALLDHEVSQDYPEYSISYKNVVLPAGVTVSSGGAKVRLSPSEGITTEDYESFYDNLT